MITIYSKFSFKHFKNYPSERCKVSKLFIVSKMYRMFYEWSNFTPISTGVGLIEVFLEVPSPASWWVYRICVISTELVSRGRARGTFSKPKPKIFGVDRDTK